MRETGAILDAIDRGELPTTDAVDNRFRVFFVHYDDYAHSWAEQVCAAMLGHAPTAEELNDVIAAGRNAHEAMRRTTDADRERDCSPQLSAGSGLPGDCPTPMDDYRARPGPR